MGLTFAQVHERWISIHAPSRERLKNIVIRQKLRFSIHAPSRERLQRHCLPLPNVICFQSTLPRGSDRLSTDCLCWRFNFQSTLPRGSDTGNSDGIRACFSFQSTLPRGSDRRCAHKILTGNIFQSTLPHGSDAA